MSAGTSELLPIKRPRGSSPRRADDRLLTGALPLLVPGVFVAVMSLYPMVRLVQMSISSVRPQNLTGEWPLNGFENFTALAASDEFRQSLVTTFIFTGVMLTAVLILGFIAAVWLTSTSLASRVAQGLMILGWALPPVVTGTAWKFMLQTGGPLNALLESLGMEPVRWLSSADIALWSVIAVVTWANIPFSAIVIKSALLGIPEETIEAAALDGAGTVRTAVYIILPQMKGVLTTLAILVFVYGFGNSFSFIYVMTAGGPGTVTTTLPFLGYVAAFRNFQFGAAGAIAVISMVIVAVFTLGYIRASGREAVER